MVAVITINFNLSRETISCVKSILDSEYHDFKIFLIDNGSEWEDYQELIAAFINNSRVMVLRIDTNRGYVGGVNFGLQKAMESDPDYFLVMNNDTIIDKSAIGYLVDAAIRYNNMAIVSGKVYYYDNPDVLQHTGEIITDFRYNFAISPGKNEKDVGQFDEDLERDTLDDVFWLLPASILKDVGFYCNYFFLYAEQADYSLRAKKNGYKLIYTPGAKLWHKVSMTSGGGNIQAPSICYWRGQGLFIMQYRHLLTGYFFIIVIRCFARFISRALLKRGDERKCAAALLRGYLWGFKWMFNQRPNEGFNPYGSNKK